MDLYGQDILLVRVLKDLQDQLVLRVQWVKEVHKVQQVLQDQLVLKVPQDQQVHKVLRVIKEQQVLLQRLTIMQITEL